MGKKKKIAILTQQLGYNYGGVIQNYALQKILRDRGYLPVTINRVLDNPHSRIKIALSKYKSLCNRYILGKSGITFLDYKYISKSTFRFIKQHINLSLELSSTSALKRFFENKRFDAVIVGSDQVWRPRYSPDIFNFFLDFLQNDTTIKKIAYAASFGTSDWEFTQSQTDYCTKLVQEFDAVSVRERAGLLLCENFLKRSKVQVVVDPTLLLTADDYDRLIGRETEKYGLFTYTLDKSSKLKEFIQQCSEILSLEVHQNQAAEACVNIDRNRLSDYVIPPIEGWLQGFRDSEFILTDSFHGTVFSIINNKPFFVFVNKERGASRFESLLGQLGLEDRLIYDTSAFDFTKLSHHIDYTSVNEKLHRLREDSLLFIENNL